jgi:hypothetical protein
MDDQSKELLAMLAEGFVGTLADRSNAMPTCWPCSNRQTDHARLSGNWNCTAS